MIGWPSNLDLEGRALSLPTTMPAPYKRPIALANKTNSKKTDLQILQTTEQSERHLINTKPTEMHQLTVFSAGNITAYFSQGSFSFVLRG